MTRDENFMDASLEELIDMAGEDLHFIRRDDDGQWTAVTSKPDVWFTEPTLKRAVEKLLVQVRVRGI